ncbi:MAG: hypothetical protein KBT13_00150, partial [Bacteroidales bacterium]|nr:hypothetical protein [Candidatus Sodaliphilus limicaballi]
MPWWAPVATKSTASPSSKQSPSQCRTIWLVVMNHYVSATPSRSVRVCSFADGLRPSVTMQCDDSVVNYQP